MTDVVTVDQVSKRFSLRDEPVQTLKERVLRAGRGSGTRDFWALDDVSFTVSDGETIGLIGHNGSGKSTLLKCIGGILQPSSGTVATRGRVASLLELGAGFSPDLTGRENVFLNGSILGLGRRDLDARMDDIIDFAELGQFIDNPVRTYSSGMYVRLGFAIAVNVDPDILLVDEVLAVGDEAFQARCLGRIREFQADGRTIIFVTHGVDTVRQLCTRAVVLSAGKMIAIGEPSECIRRFRDSLAHRRSWYAGDSGGEMPEVSDDLRDLTTQLATIEAVSLHDTSGAPIEAINAGEAFSIVIDVDAPDRVDDVAAAIALFDSAGTPLWSNSTEHFSPLPALEGSCRLTLDIAALPLQAGPYTLATSLHTRDNVVVHDVKETRLDVDNPRMAVGLIDLDVKLRVGVDLDDD